MFEGICIIFQRSLFHSQYLLSIDCFLTLFHGLSTLHWSKTKDWVCIWTYEMVYVACTKVRKHILYCCSNMLTPPLFIEVPVPDQGSEQSCICVLGVSILLFIRIFYSILEVIWLCGMFCFLQFILVLPYYFTIVYPVKVLDCVIIYRAVC
jgi:hypothetical protein